MTNNSPAGGGSPPGRAEATAFIGRAPGYSRDGRAAGSTGREAIAVVKAAVATATRQLGAEAPDAWQYTSSVFIGVIAEVLQLHPEAILHSVHTLSPFGRGPFFTDGRIGMVAQVMLPYVDSGEIVVELDLTGTPEQISLGTDTWVGYFLSKKPSFAGLLRATDVREIQRMMPLRAYVHAYAEELMSDPYHSGHIAWE